jgi:hypothetical protein
VAIVPLDVAFCIGIAEALAARKANEKAKFVKRMMKKLKIERDLNQEIRKFRSQPGDAENRILKKDWSLPLGEKLSWSKLSYFIEISTWQIVY